VSSVSDLSGLGGLSNPSGEGTNARDAEEAISQMLGIRAQLAISEGPAQIESLTTGELGQFRTLRSGPACLDWLRGRAALKALLAQGYDTSGLQFPNRTISLTHAGGLAVAVRTDDDCEGIGIDFEPWGTGVEPRAAHLFLTPSEQVGPLPPGGLLQLWTIKEALYKATAGNQWRLLLDFEVHDTAASCGEATGPGGEALRYAALRLERGVLATAVCDKTAPSKD
jgi:4'-phosphopantetheinyl transferase superfamily